MLEGWLPYQLMREPDGLYLKWIYLAKDLDDPFFEDTVICCKRSWPNNKGFQVVTSIEMMEQWSCDVGNVPLRALIYHVSRCGSTLLCQMLNTSTDNVVISEAPLIDQLINYPEASLAQRESWIKAYVRILGACHNGLARHLFIKLDSWHLLRFGLLRSIFPDLPFVALVREPLAVWRSHKRMAGIHMVPRLLPAYTLDMDESEYSNATFGTYEIFVLERFYRVFLEVIPHDANTLILDYGAGGKHWLINLVEFLGFGYSQADFDKMLLRANKHSKRPEELFNEPISDLRPECGMGKLPSLYQQIVLMTNAEIDKSWSLKK